MQLATYGAYGICVLISVLLLIITAYVRGGGFVTELVFYLLAAASFLSRESFALTNDGGGKKGSLFYLMIFLVSILAVMSIVAILFGIYLLIGNLILNAMSA